VAESASAPKDLIGFLDYYLVRKAPFQIPSAGREAIARFAPWIVIILLIVSVPVMLFALRLGAWAPVALGGSRWGGPGLYWAYGYGYWLWAPMVVVNFVLMAAALPGLFARRASGWRLAFFAELVRVLVALLSLAIVSGLLTALIAFYILFQIRSLYR
jgi:hypothetical protein